MSNMKKHSFIQVEFHSTVKITLSDSVKIQKWLKMASEVMEKLILNRGLVHPSWLKNAECLKVSVLLCGETKIRNLNLDYRSKDKVTDVLSFPTYTNLRKTKTRDEFASAEIFLGDLAICHQRTQRQAKEFNISYWDEFIHLFMHGMIHLIGYDHELSAKEEKLMESWENEALNLFTKIKKRGLLKAPLYSN